MRVVVSAEGSGMGAQASPIFGRCPVYVFVDTDTMAVESVPNPAQNTPGGAGIEAAQFVVSRGIQAVLAGNVGPNAAGALAAAGVAVYLVRDLTVEKAVQALASGDLTRASPGATIQGEVQVGSGHSIEPRTEELAPLRAKLAELRKELAEIMTRINTLQKED